MVEVVVVATVVEENSVGDDCKGYLVSGCYFGWCRDSSPVFGGVVGLVV